MAEKMDAKEFITQRYVAMYVMLQHGRPRSEVAQRFCCNRAATYRAEKYVRSEVMGDAHQFEMLHDILSRSAKKND